jgi:hypothetical protein
MNFDIQSNKNNKNNNNKKTRINPIKVNKKKSWLIRTFDGFRPPCSYAVYSF